jgi:uncharacterized damage-inducible protein DinB
MEIRTIDEFLDYLPRVRRRTDAVLEVIAPEDIDWAPGPRQFSFADLLRHLAAIERWMFAENVAGRPSRYPGHGPDLADGYDEVIAYFLARRAEALDVYRGLSDADLERTCVTPGGAELRVWKWLRAMFEHEMHHRGQLFLMASLRGRPPRPLYGVTS